MAKVLRGLPKDAAVFILLRLRSGRYTVPLALDAFARLGITLAFPPAISPPVAQTLQAVLVQFTNGAYSIDDMCLFLGE